MKYLLQVSDASSRCMVVFTLDESIVKHPAADVVFEVLGEDNPESLIRRGILPEGQIDDFKTLQALIFDSDDQGKFIRNEVSFAANGGELNPDRPMQIAFLPAQKEGIEYRRCEMIVGNGEIKSGTGQHGSIPELRNVMFVHQLSMGAYVDVTKDFPELTDVIAWAEKDGLIEIDVKKAGYKLTEKGNRLHASYIEEAQNLIRRYDIFADVDADSAGNAHFDTGLGQDLRVPVYEMEGVDPFRARFLLGLNDGEWDKMQNWMAVLEDENWYRGIFKPIENAPSVDDIGKERLMRIIDQGKQRLRQESQPY